MSKTNSLIDGDDSEDVKPPDFMRNSSFAASFFQAGSGHPALCFTGDDNNFTPGSASRSECTGGLSPSTTSFTPSDNNTQSATTDINMELSMDQIPIPRARPALMRRASSRRSQRSVPRDSFSSSMNRLRLSSSGAIQEESKSPIPSCGITDDADVLITPPSLPSRQASWYQDALGQGMTEEQIAVLMGLPAPSEGTPVSTYNSYQVEGSSGGFEDDEVLEQYRILAHHEARRLVQEKLGDVLDKPRPLPPPEEEPMEFEIPMPPQLTALLNQARNAIQPDIKPLKSTLFLPPRLTTPPPLSPLPRPVNLLPGRLLGDDDDDDDDSSSATRRLNGTSKRISGSYPEVQVVCPGCLRTLAVGCLATMVQCPACAVISPATYCSAVNGV